MTTIAHHAAAARSHNASHNEGGEGYNGNWAKHDAAVAAAGDAHIDALVARAPELRAAWNAAVAKFAVNGNVATKDLQKIEAAAGITLNELKLVQARLAK